MVNGQRVLRYEEFLEAPASTRHAVLAIANSEVRKQLADRCVTGGVQPWTLIAANVVVMDEVTLGEGAILSPFVTLGSNVRIGRHFHANLYSYVEHDCVIGDFVTFAPGVKCNGNVVIEDHAYIGTGAVIKQGKPGQPLVIGRGAVIGMGAVVTRACARRRDRRRQPCPATHQGLIMLNTSFSPWPSFTTQEAEAVVRVLMSNKVNYWTGDECREFEREFAAWSRRRACRVAGQRHAGAGCGAQGDAASARATKSSSRRAPSLPACPASSTPAQRPSSPTSIPTAATSRPRPSRGPSRRAPRAVICVHLAGWPCDMDPIMALAAEHGIKVIEDCAQAHGARYKGRSVGTLGHAGAFSFCQDKIMTTGGEGGMVTTHDADLWRAVW